jgi:hypothetical protein
MTNEQLYPVIGVPVVFNAAITLALWLNLRANMNQRFDSVNERFAAINQRFDDMRDLWRAELRRVEEVFDAP